jgi:hypothetical protein
MRTLFALLSLTLLIQPTLAAVTCTAQSGSTRTSLLELYTSEGCSSCPPADRWLSSLSQQEIDQRHLLPLAFHVDYWNNLGWRDPYSQAAFSARQRQQNGLLGWVYTPQFMLDGVDFRAGDNAPKAAPAATRATLKLALDKQASLRWTVQVGAGLSAPTPGHAVYVALYENRLVSQVGAGENAQRTLRHDYVVRKLEGPFAVGADGQFKDTLHFALNPDWKPQDMGIAAFVEAANGNAIQALALPACR